VRCGDGEDGDGWQGGREVDMNEREGRDGRSAREWWIRQDRERRRRVGMIRRGGGISVGRGRTSAMNAGAASGKDAGRGSGHV
jgi:hypothetical protein